MQEAGLHATRGHEVRLGGEAPSKASGRRSGTHSGARRNERSGSFVRQIGKKPASVFREHNQEDSAPESQRIKT